MNNDLFNTMSSLGSCKYLARFPETLVAEETLGSNCFLPLPTAPDGRKSLADTLSSGFLYLLS